MSNFTPKRGPNISQYLADLNSVQAPQESSLEDPYALENDLGLFTSVEFSDPFDLDDSTDPADVNFGQSASGKEDVAGCKDGGDSDVKNMNFGDGTYLIHQKCCIPHGDRCALVRVAFLFELSNADRRTV